MCIFCLTLYVLPLFFNFFSSFTVDGKKMSKCSVHALINSLNCRQVVASPGENERTKEQLMANSNK